jgi:PKD repeat protein
VATALVVFVLLSLLAPTVSAGPPNLGFAASRTSSASPLIADIVFHNTSGWGSLLVGPPVYPTAPYQVNVTALVTGGVPPYDFRWNFGDGTPTDASASCNHTYELAGPYILTLTATDTTGNTSISQVPLTVDPPSSSEDWVLLELFHSVGTAPLTVHIGDQGSEWNTVAARVAFGDGVVGNWTGVVGNAGSSVNLWHNYTTPGVYSVTAHVEEYNFVNRTFGNTTAGGTVVVTDPAEPPSAALYSLGARVVCSPFPVWNTSFTSEAFGGVPPYAFLWSFGDGSPITSGAVANHTYAFGATNQTVVIQLVVIDSTGHAGTTSAPFPIPASSATSCPIPSPASSTWAAAALWELGFWIVVGVTAALAIAVVVLYIRRRPGA